MCSIQVAESGNGRDDIRMARKRTVAGNPAIAVGYVRVSTEDQDLGPEAQRAALAAWSARTGVRIVSVHEDRLSGATEATARPGLVAALADVRSNAAGILVAAKRDRLARDVVVSAMVARAVSEAGAVIRTADGASDMTGPEAVMVGGIADVFAAYERAVIRARTRAALAVKRSRGERTGRVPFGYRVASDGVHLEPDTGEQGIIAMVRELRASGLSHRGIVAALASRGIVSRTGQPLRQTQVARILARPETSEAAAE